MLKYAQWAKVRSSWSAWTRSSPELSFQLREERKKAREEERQKLLRERNEHIDRNKLREALMAGPSQVHTESHAFAAANAEQGIPPLLTRSMIVHKDSPVRLCSSRCSSGLTHRRSRPPGAPPPGTQSSIWRSSWRLPSATLVQ